MIHCHDIVCIQGCFPQEDDKKTKSSTEEFEKDSNKRLKWNKMRLKLLVHVGLLPDSDSPTLGRLGEVGSQKP